MIKPEKIPEKRKIPKIYPKNTKNLPPMGVRFAVQGGIFANFR